MKKYCSFLLVMCLVVLSARAESLQENWETADLQQFSGYEQQEDAYTAFVQTLDNFRVNVQANQKTTDGYYEGAYELMDLYFQLRHTQSTRTLMRMFKVLSEDFEAPVSFCEEMSVVLNPENNTCSASAFAYLRYMVSPWINNKTLKYSEQETKRKHSDLLQDNRAFRYYQQSVQPV